MPSQSNNKSQSPDLHQMTPTVDPAAITIMLCKPFGGFCCPLYKLRKNERKGKRNAARRGSEPAAPFGAARALQSALALRRSTTALA
jgi:hypothetical protein